MGRGALALLQVRRHAGGRQGAGRHGAEAGPHHGQQNLRVRQDADEQADLWSARKEALWSVMAMKENATDHVWTGDVAVPISRLPDIINETKDDLAASGLFAAIVGHVGDGNFHSASPAPLINPRTFIIC